MDIPIHNFKWERDRICVCNRIRSSNWRNQAKYITKNMVWNDYHLQSGKIKGQLFNFNVKSDNRISGV